MANNTYKTRVQLKNDTAENWIKAVKFIPLNGEAIVYSDLNKIKIGDGITNVNDLPFTAGIDEVYVGTTAPANGEKIWINPSEWDNVEEDNEEYALKSELKNYQLKNEAFSGSYNDLKDRPTLFSGSYDDLTGKPAIATSVSSNEAKAVSGKAVYDYVQQVFGQLTNGDGVRY